MPLWPLEPRKSTRKKWSRLLPSLRALWTLPLLPCSQTTAVPSVCPYCGVGCALTYHVHDDHILWAEGRDSPGNEGRLCVKGRYGWDYAQHPQRLTKPLIRRQELYPKGPLSGGKYRVELRAVRTLGFDLFVQVDKAGGASPSPEQQRTIQSSIVACRDKAR